MSDSFRQLSLCAAGVSAGKIRLLTDYLSPGGRILDIGCGSGLYGVHLESMGCDVMQIDVADRRDERARHLPFRIMDARHLENNLGEFDDVIAFDVMEHMDDDADLLRQIQRICRHRLFLSVPNAEDTELERLGVTHKHHKDKTHRREYYDKQLIDLLDDQGFTVLSLRPNHNVNLPCFAGLLARKGKLSMLAAKLITWQCKGLLACGVFERHTVCDWYCVAEKTGKT